MSTIFLGLEFSTGNLFHYSKEPKEGYDKHETKDKNGNVTKTSYRKYYTDGIYGKYLGYEKKESTIGEQLVICFENMAGDVFQVSWALNDVKGFYQTYTTSFFQYVPKLEIGVEYFFRPFAFTPKDSEHKRYGVQILFGREVDNAVDKDNLIERLTFERKGKDGNVTQEGDIPASGWKQIKGKWEINNEVRDNYLYENVFQKYMVEGVSKMGGNHQNTFNSKEEPQTTTMAKPPVAKEKPAGGMQPNNNFDTKTAPTVSEDEEDDTLPF